MTRKPTIAAEAAADDAAAATRAPVEAACDVSTVGTAETSNAPVEAVPEPARAIAKLTDLAARIADRLVWNRAELIAELTDDHGLMIDRTIEGVRIALAGITVDSPIIGPGGEHQALDNWANAARRKVLELEAAG